MTEVIELVGMAMPLTDWECPFDHRKKEHNKENYLPPPSTKNDPTKLGKNLETESHHRVIMHIDFKVGSKEYLAPVHAGMGQRGIPFPVDGPKIVGRQPQIHDQADHSDRKGSHRQGDHLGQSPRQLT